MFLPSAFRLLPLTRHWPLWLVFGLVLALAVWARPRRIETLATLDGKHQWRVERESSTRQFAWQPGEELTDLLPPHDPPDDISHPCLANGGRTLYVTVRRGGGDADIYRSEWSGGHWGPAEAVTELNTPWDEIGTAISNDGGQLWLASDRRGGKGGLDLYVAEQRASRWGVPKNLNGVNSAADDFDPAPSPDGLRLCFASTRADERTSDLYFADRSTLGDPWSAAEPLRRANSDANERSPCFGEGGSVVYFASDLARHGRPSNFDLYRLRVSDFTAPVESLGAGVNSLANESDPTLSADGFGISFTRRLEHGSGRLYRSRLAEVERVVRWDNNRWLVLRAVWWKVLLAVIVCTALLASFYYGRGWIRRQAAASRFVAASALVHLVLVWLLLLVPLSQEIVKRLEEIQVSGDARDSFEENLAEVMERNQPAYEKVADLQAVEQAETPPPARQTTTADMPLPVDHFAATLPLDLTHRVPDDRVVFIPSQRKIVQDLSGIERRVEAEVRVADIEPLLVVPPDQMTPAEEEKLTETVELPRTAVVSTAPRLPLEQQRPPSDMVMPRQLPQPAAPRLQDTSQIERLPRRVVDEAAAPPKIDPEAPELAAVERTDEQAVLGAAPPELSIAVNEVAVAPKLNDEPAAAPAAQARIAPLAIQPQMSEQRSDSLKVKLPRSQRVPADVAALVEEPAVAAKVDAPVEEVIAATKVDLPIAGPALPRLADSSRMSALPPADHDHSIAGTSAKRPMEAPAANPLKTQLERPAARMTAPALAQDNLGMQAMFALRQGETRREFIELVGGNDETEAAVKRGLKWLAEHQHADGHWSLNQLDPPEKKLAASSGAGGTASDTAATGLALLCFLGSGYTHLAGDYQDGVSKGVGWLVANQKADGNLFTGPPSNAFMYSHGIASIALCEAYGLSQDERLRDPAQRALRFIVAAQHQGTGGWRYQPGEPGDTSVVGWQVMALKSGEMAGLEVPQASLELASKWLTSAAGSGGAVGQFGYQGPGGSPAMSAEGLLCRQFLGMRRNDPVLLAGANYLRVHLPQAGVETSYYWYYATQVMYHMQGDYWTAWNEPLRGLLVSSQIKDGHQAGTWDPRDGWEQQGGRLYATALRVLMLEVYYRHLPLYQQWE